MKQLCSVNPLSYLSPNGIISIILVNNCAANVGAEISTPIVHIVHILFNPNSFSPRNLWEIFWQTRTALNHVQTCGAQPQIEITFTSVPQIPWPPPRRWWSKPSLHFGIQTTVWPQKKPVFVNPACTFCQPFPPDSRAQAAETSTNAQTLKKQQLQHNTTINAPQWCINAIDAYTMQCGKPWGPHTFSGCDRSRSPFSCVRVVCC